MKQNKKQDNFWMYLGVSYLILTFILVISFGINENIKILVVTMTSLIMAHLCIIIHNQYNRK